MAPVKLLALDLSSFVGFALMERGRPPVLGTLRLVPGHRRRRFCDLHDWLQGMLGIHQFNAMAYEEPILPRRSGDLATTMETLRLLWGLASTAELFAAQHDLPCEGVDVKAVKIALTNKQHATKTEMIAAAMQLGWKPATEHEADAGAVGLVAYERIWPKARAA